LLDIPEYGTQRRVRIAFGCTQIPGTKGQERAARQQQREPPAQYCQYVTH
jgi:hypothetical protein